MYEIVEKKKCQFQLDRWKYEISISVDGTKSKIELKNGIDEIVP